MSVSIENKQTAQLALKAFQDGIPHKSHLFLIQRTVHDSATLRI